MSKNGNINDDSPIKSGLNGSDKKKYDAGYSKIDWAKKDDKPSDEKESDSE